MIDKSAIRVRPYTEADKDQVLETLFLGFNMVGDRIFHKTVRARSTALSILAKSLIYTLVVELALVTLSAVNNPSSNIIDNNVGSNATWGEQSVLDNFKALYEALMEPASVQGMVTQFLQPSFIVIGLVITVLVTLATIYSIYSSNQRDTEIYIQGCLDDDLGDIVSYYQKEVPVDVTDKQDKSGDEEMTKTKTRKNRSQFWVACLESHPQVVLGCISLDDIAAHTAAFRYKHLKQGGDPSSLEPPSDLDAELRRLSVHPNYRRLGVAKLLMQTLQESAKKQGFKRVILSTTIHQSEALVGYIRFGFEKEKMERFTEFFTLWYGELKLNSTQKERDAQKERQPELMKEIGMLTA
ncbi:MAG: acyl-CoA N-acyltransferase [Linnemannia gamsii]|nr:MAG: acyl-CoA N-acyltransferase [Linnemannia gamsii]